MRRPSTDPAGQKTAVLLDQHPLWLDGLESVLSGIGVEVVAATETAEDLVGLVKENEPDVLIAETQIPEGGKSVLPALREALELQPELKIVVLSTSSAEADIADAFDVGADAYIVKTTHPDDIASAIRQAFRHSIFFATPHEATPERRTMQAVPSGLASENEAGLTRRESEILRLVAEGHSNSQLARMLWVTEQTVKFHLSNVYRKLEVANRTEASRWAYTHNVLGHRPDDAEVDQGAAHGSDGHGLSSTSPAPVEARRSA